MAEYEAIVRDIQQGSREKLPELWEAVRPFAARQANRRMTAYREHNSDYAIDTEDLIQVLCPAAGLGDIPERRAHVFPRMVGAVSKNGL